MAPNTNTKKGILYILLSAFCFALMNLFIRLAGDVPSLQKCFFRNLFAFFIALATMLRSKTDFRSAKGNMRFLLARSIAGGIGMMCNFYAVDRLPISDASILNKLSPFFAIIFSVWVVGEIANRWEWLAVAVAFVGALFVARPTFSVEAIPAMAGVIGGLGAGIAYTFVRKMGMRGVSGKIIVAFFSGFTSLLLTPYMVFCSVAMSGMQWLFMILTGLAAAGGQLAITKAYTLAPAKEISVYDYSIVIFSAILGFVFLDQIPDMLSLVGYAIIIGAAVWKWSYSRHSNNQGS